MNPDLIIVIIIGIAALLFIFYNLKYKSKENQENTKKVLQYFGGDYCPFSNSNSNAYKVIKDFEKEYGDKVTVNYYWVGLDDDYMKELNVDYVPYILNGDNKQIEIALPEGTDLNLPESELKPILLESIYNKL
jgi:predicted SpoU family rRNA methylase